MVNPEFICEFTTNHMGNFNLLMEMVKKASETGADYIKMQKKDVDTFYTQEKLNSPYVSPYGKTYGDYRRIFEFDKREFDHFDMECKKHDIKWFATAQDVPSLEFLLNYDLDMYKLASCNANKHDLLKEFSRLIPNNRTVVLSVAGRVPEEIDSALDIFKDHKVILNHCVAEYPCRDENLRLGNIEMMKKMWGSDRVKIGYSGHEQGIVPSIGAAMMGAEFIERHFCLSRDSFVHHIECSLEPDEFEKMVHVIRNEEYDPDGVEEILGSMAWCASFGMSEMEKSFLLHNRYGDDYLRERSEDVEYS
tara:strand:- start:105 stop:1022 length:918 start_codon:yes stop_codon:yes gene_type:complete